MNQNPSGQFISKRSLLKILTASTIVLFGTVIIYSLKEFIDAALGAVIIYVLFRPMMRWLTVNKKWKATSATLLIFLITFISVLAPAFLIISLLIPKLTLFFSDESFLVQLFHNTDVQLKSLLGIDLFAAENISKIQGAVTTEITDLLGQTFSIFGDIILMYFILYFMLINVNKLEAGIEKLIPMSKANLDKFGAELKSMTISNVIGSPLLSLFQGFVASLGFWIFGLPEPVFWGMMAGVFSFIPFIGSAIIWLPAAIFQLSNGYLWQGIAIIIFGIAIISTIDNVFRFVFQKKFADVHPMVTVFGIILGLQLFGIPGFIFGPLIISWLLILIKIYREEYIANSNQIELNQQVDQ